jgi:U3 small nucleolar RNA-associated protein 10
VPYFSFMLDQTIELLGSFSCSELVDSDLFTSLLDALTKSLTYDESGFWTPLRLRKLSSPIASPLSSPFSSSLLHAHLHPLLAAYSRALLPHELLLKGFNSSILMSTRSDSLSIKRASLEALEQLWDNLGDGMLLFVPETTPFLAETLEETEEGVAMVTMRLIKRIEEHLGETLDSYLEN